MFNWFGVAVGIGYFGASAWTYLHNQPHLAVTYLCYAVGAFALAGVRGD